MGCTSSSSSGKEPTAKKGEILGSSKNEDEKIVEAIKNTVQDIQAEIHEALDTTYDAHKHALSTILVPKLTPEYYIGQGNAYFNFLEAGDLVDVKVKYAHNLARWEWKPWLLLTGYKDDATYSIDAALAKLIIFSIPQATREMRFFTTQPFCRCKVVIFCGADVHKKEKPLNIYEEFTFNDKGEITFIEAWSIPDPNGLIPDVGPDGWPLQNTVQRISTVLPGLGSRYAEIDIDTVPSGLSDVMTRAVKEFDEKARHFIAGAALEALKNLHNPAYSTMLK